MTTNQPDDLDDALIRPGRIDLEIAFSNATQHQATELFERMYATDAIQTRLPTASGPLMDEVVQDEKSPIAKGTPINASNKVSDHRATKGKSLRVISGGEKAEDLKALALHFSKHIQDGMFSPAELQGFLLQRKHDPEKACKDIGSWVEEMVEAKKVDRKILPQK